MTMLNDPNFWVNAEKNLGRILTDGSLRYIVLEDDYMMRPIVRSREELFVDTLQREGKDMKVVINGSFYDVSFDGKVDAKWGHDPVPAYETTILGQVVQQGAVISDSRSCRLIRGVTVITGTSEPNLFWFGQRKTPSPKNPFWNYVADSGNPPQGPDMMVAVGGLGPLIVGALKYGVGNVYKPGVSGPVTGAPPPSLQPSLIQRNNETFKSAESRPAATGKTILASSVSKRRILIAVQEHGLNPGQTYVYIATSLLGNGFEHAVFLDGSDSATLMYEGKMVVTPGENKDETNILGIGFKR
jgi:hypothetical protein